MSLQPAEQLPASLPRSCSHITINLGLSTPHLSLVGSPQQYEATSISSVFAKHLPTVQSLLRLQGKVSHCLFNLTTKFCQSHHKGTSSLLS